MKEVLISTYYRLLDDVKTQYHRYLFSRLDIEQRLIGIIGGRGTGKTTMMLQYIKEKIPETDRALYFSADHIYFSANSLFEFVRDQYELEGRFCFFIDEVHKYPNWSQELKNLYDSFPKLHIVFSGSSSIDLSKGSYDLSRRVLLHKLKGLSFREFLLFEQGIDLPVHSLEDILSTHLSIARALSQVGELRGLFKEYLQNGYYPFYFEDKQNYSQRLLRVIEKTIYEDVASFYNLNTANLPTLKKILTFLATSQPGNFSVNSLSNSLGIDNKTVASYLEMLRTTELIAKLEFMKSGSAAIRKPEKVFLANPNLYHSICSETGRNIPIGTIRESFVLAMMTAVGKMLRYTPVGDFEYNDTILEIGGRSKSGKQVRDVQNSYIVKDDILVSAEKKTIPLHLFGFLY